MKGFNEDVKVVEVILVQDVVGAECVKDVVGYGIDGVGFDEVGVEEEGEVTLSRLSSIGKEGPKDIGSDAVDFRNRWY